MMMIVLMVLMLMVVSIIVVMMMSAITTLQAMQAMQANTIRLHGGPRCLALPQARPMDRQRLPQPVQPVRQAVPLAGGQPQDGRWIGQLA